MAVKATAAPNRELLMEILSFARPHESETEQRFNREFLDTIPGMRADAFGNRYLRIGDNPTVMWSSHVDTVAKACGPQQLAFDEETGIVQLAKGKPGMSLGADDGAGVWIMLEMIRNQRPGLYVFHRGEEQGCLGSEHILKHEPFILEGIEAAVAFDRAGQNDIITHQAFGRTCSDSFAESLASHLNRVNKDFRFEPDPTGVYTDTNTYAGVIPECSNVSVGYNRNHGPAETLDVYHAEALLRAILTLELDDLTIDRDPMDPANQDWGYSKTTTTGGWQRAIETPYDELLDLIKEYPEVTAMLLMGKAVTADDLWSEVLDFHDPDPRYDDRRIMG